MTSLLARIRELATTRETPDEVFDYYQQQYPGHKTLKNGKTIFAWQSKLADDLSQVLGIKRESVMRRFQGARAGKISKSQADEYQALGEMLPPNPPDNGYLVSGTIYVKYSNDCEEREIEPPMHISYEDAKRMLAMDTDKAVQAVANAYQADQDEADINFKGPEWCAEPILIVEEAP
jgi:hypothetical protein